MISVTFIAADGSQKVIQARPGLSLMENAVAGGVEEIEAICGGNAYCGTCRVYVAPGWQAITGAITEIEEPMIETTGDEDPAVRLSCQITVSPELDGLVVRTPASQG